MSSMPTNRELSIETDIIWWMNEKLDNSDGRIKLSDLVQIEWCVLMKKRESYLHKKVWVLFLQYEWVYF